MISPTTTLWKSGFRFSREKKRRFLGAYRQRAGLKLPAGELGERKETLERTILLGSMSWCFIAHSEYTVTNRPLADRSTFERIRMCLKEMEDFLGLYG